MYKIVNNEAPFRMLFKFVRPYETLKPRNGQQNPLFFTKFLRSENWHRYCNESGNRQLMRPDLQNRPNRKGKPMYDESTIVEMLQTLSNVQNELFREEWDNRFNNDLELVTRLAEIDVA